MRRLGRAEGGLGGEDVVKRFVKIRTNRAVLIDKESQEEGFVKEPPNLVRCLLVVRLRVGNLIERLGKQLTTYGNLFTDIGETIFNTGTLYRQLVHLLANLRRRQDAVSGNVDEATSLASTSFS
ncbi:hypothetical protein QF047_000550 [Arthrobacter sp. W4I7]|nr:hypothetical protein [Arthrobacter sp. W4I7]